MFRHDYRASAHQKLGLDPASWALIGSAVLGAGGTAYQARQQKQAGKEADLAAKKAQLQPNQSALPADIFKRKRNGGQGFDPASVLLSGAGGGNLLGS